VVVWLLIVIAAVSVKGPDSGEGAIPVALCKGLEREQ